MTMSRRFSLLAMPSQVVNSKAKSWSQPAGNPPGDPDNNPDHKVLAVAMMTIEFCATFGVGINNPMKANKV